VFWCLSLGDALAFFLDLDVSLLMVMYFYTTH
jgi:hypothetical protein